MAAPPAWGRARSSDPVHGRMNSVPAHMAYAVTSKPVYLASSGFCAVWKMPCSTAAASTTSAEAPKPSPCETAMTAVPASATPLPIHHRRPGCSPRNIAASTLA